MGRPETCMRCGSTDLIPRARVCGYGSSDVRVFVDRRPEALFMTGSETEPLRACVCASCGHVETFVVDAEQLRQAYLERE